jgi:hypothetical protein
MKHLMVLALLAGLLGFTNVAAAQGAKPLKKCPPDAVVSGTVCMDKYEASVWHVPDPQGTNRALVKKIQEGRATEADLVAGGAMQLGVSGDDYGVTHYIPCRDDGQTCGNYYYATSLPGVIPSSWITWFQAQAACKNARKRLPSNAEWQAAAAGTPDPVDGLPGQCYTGNGAALPTGSRVGCSAYSDPGTPFDMVGNLSEWVADWVPHTAVCRSWQSTFGMFSSDDFMCFGSILMDPAGGPGAIIRGGFWGNSYDAGPLAVDTATPQTANDAIGFRCAR